MKKLKEIVLTVATTASLAFSAGCLMRLHSADKEDKNLRSISDDVVEVITSAHSENYSDDDLYMLWVETYGLLKTNPERVQRTLKKYGAEVRPEYQQVYTEVCEIVSDFKS